VELLPAVTCQGMPRQAAFEQIDSLAQLIAEKHKTAGL
jgi:hypothetical protein